TRRSMAAAGVRREDVLRVSRPCTRGAALAPRAAASRRLRRRAPDSRLGAPRPRLRLAAQVERHHAVVLPDAAVARGEVPAEAGGVAQPPEAGPAEDDVRRPARAQALELPDGRLVIVRGAPVLAVTLGERDGAAPLADLVAERRLVDEDERLARRHQAV